MSEFEYLIGKLLEQNQEISREEIEERIKQKKEKIGAGYLTDQGALFLIASDLGISLSQPQKAEMGLKDLYVGAKEISLETRILNLSPIKQFSRKDGTEFFLRTMTVYDSDTTASVKLWDEKANLPELENLRPGDLIKIIKAYVKSDLRGSPTINVGSGSSIETSHDKSDIPSIDNITIDVESLKENQNNIVVQGKINGLISTLEFTNSQGKPGKALRFNLKDAKNNIVRVILWGKDETNIPKFVSKDAKVKLFGARTKLGNQGLEIHGNDSTIIEVEGKDITEPIALRIVSISTNKPGLNQVLGVDKQKNLIQISDSAQKINSFNPGDVIEFMPTKVYGNTINIDNDSFLRKIDDVNEIISISDIRTKISDIKVGTNYCIEAIVIKEPERREVQTKTGETISLSEMFIEDDSKQIWLKGWREQASLIDKCSIGEIVSVTGVTAKDGLEGRIELFLTPFSVITRKN